MKYIILGVMLLCMNHVTAQDKVRLKENSTSTGSSF